MLQPVGLVQQCTGNEGISAVRLRTPHKPQRQGGAEGTAVWITTWHKELTLPGQRS